MNAIIAAIAGLVFLGWDHTNLPGLVKGWLKKDSTPVDDTSKSNVIKTIELLEEARFHAKVMNNEEAASCISKACVALFQQRKDDKPNG